MRSKRTKVKDSESADEFILAREAVVRFVQDSIAEAVDRLKRKTQTRMEGQTFFYSMKVDLVLLSMVNLPRHIVTNMGSNKLLPKFIGPFRVLRR